MQRVLVATDADEIFDEVDAALGEEGVEFARVRAGRQVLKAVLEFDPDLVVLDLQIGSMGGVAACLDLRLEESGGRLEPQAILLLLDREADLFIAQQSGADGWLMKPLDAGRIRRASEAITNGGTYTELAPARVG